MWFSFFSNVLTFVVATGLCLTIGRTFTSKYFYTFVLLTGVSSLVAAFGHLEILDLTLQKVLLFTSRVLNMIAIYSFATGAFKHFGYYENKGLRILNPALIVGAVAWLALTNVFTPVMLYGVVGMLLFGLLSFVRNYTANKESYLLVIIGVLFIAMSALNFAIFKHHETYIAADVSHFLIAISMIFISFGFRKMKISLNEN
ncbi:MAG: DUF6962 family protein [Bacteroidia bacterium]